MKKTNEIVKLNKNAKTLGAVYIYTHTDSFKSIKNNAIFAFINNIKKAVCKLSL